MFIKTLPLSVTQVLLVKQMAETWRVHLQSVLRVARNRGNEMVVHNTESDLRDLEEMLRQLETGEAPTEKMERTETTVNKLISSGRVIDVE